MKFLSIILLAFIIAGSFRTRNEVKINPKLTCSLTSDKAVYQIGETPKFEVRLINESKQTIYLPGSLDGSDIRLRMPYCYFSVMKPKADTIQTGRCGVTNPLTIGDFKLIPPGQVFDPYREIDGFFPDYAILQKETFRNPGIYNIQFHYSTNSEDINKFIGSVESIDKLSNHKQLKSLFEKMPKLSLVSNTIEIIIEDPKNN